VALRHPAWQRLREVFGAAYFLPDDQLDRAAMARRVFADEDARKTLEAITHPAIFDEVDRQTAALHQSSTPPPVMIVVVPLLFEVGAEDRFDAIIVVKATPRQQRERLQRTRGYSDAEADARLAAQLPLEAKLARADYLIDNTGDIEHTRTQVRDLLHTLQEKAAS
jgi:dephospho-CoA kinase